MKGMTAMKRRLIAFAILIFTLTAGHAQQTPPNAATAQLTQTFPLKTALYGIPFGSSPDDIAKWCQDKDVTMNAISDKDVHQLLRDRARLLQVIKNEEEWNDRLLPDLAKEVNRIMAIPRQEFQTRDVSEKADCAKGTLEVLNVLKWPSFRFKGEQYYLTPLVPKFYTKHNDQRDPGYNPVLDIHAYKDFVDPQFELMVFPSEEMKKAGVQRIKIFFLQEAQGLRVYGVIADFLEKHDYKRREKPAESVATAMDEKYGKRILSTINNGDPNRSDMESFEPYRDRRIPSAMKALFKPYIYLFPTTETKPHSFVDHYQPSQVFDKGTETAEAWAKNIVLVNGALLVYYDSAMAASIIAKHEAGIQKAMLAEKAAKDAKEGESKKRAKDNF